jgi:hypothetical protein
MYGFQGGRCRPEPVQPTPSTKEASVGSRGPIPKDSTQRRRRNIDARFDELPAEGYQGPFPSLPTSYFKSVDNDESHPFKRKYLAATRKWYLTWARSPQATLFTGTDWERLKMLAPLVDMYHREPRVGLATELRLQESLLGATVTDRRRMRLVVTSTEPVEPPAKLEDVRRRMRAV